MLTQVSSLLTLKQLIHQEVTLILDEKDTQGKVFSDETKLNAELGMTSLDLARLVSVLDDKLTVDPFMELIPITSVRTIGDLVNAYQQAINESRHIDNGSIQFREANR